MYDMNFFSVQKRSKSKNNGLKVFLIVFVLVVIILNVVLIGGKLFLFNIIEKNIQQKEAIINDPAMQEKIKEAEMVEKEAGFAAAYYNLLQSAGSSIEQMKHLDSMLFDTIRSLTPDEVTFQLMTIADRKITIECSAENELAVIDMYHAFTDSDKFVNVSIESISVDTATQRSAFTISFAVRGE